MLNTVDVPNIESDYNYKTVDIVNNDFKVTINGQQVPCYASRCSKIPFNRVFDGVHQRDIDQSEILGCVSFESDEPVNIEVESVRPFKTAVIRPLSKGVKVEKQGDKVKFALKNKGQYSLELDDEHNSLSIFFNEINEFSEKDYYTYYFGAGVHLVGLLNLKSDDKVYIDKDAIIYGGIYAKDAENILVEGYGLIDGKFISRLSNSLFNRGNIMMENCKNIKINGVILQDSSIWTASFFNCSNIEIDNVKITGQWRYNTDGIDFVNCKEVVLKNSFIHCFDDAIVIKGYSQFDKVNIDIIENIKVDNCVVWCGWGRTLEFGIETIAKEMKNIVIKNCNLIHNSASAIDIQNGNCAFLHDIVIENINVEFQKTTLPEVYQFELNQKYDGYGKIGMPHLIWIDNHKYGLGKDAEIFMEKLEEYTGGKEIFGKVENVFIKNVNVYAEKGLPKFKMYVVSRDPDGSFKNITIKDITVNGKKAVREQFDIVVDDRVENLKLF